MCAILGCSGLKYFHFQFPHFLLCSPSTHREDFESELKKLTAVGMKAGRINCMDEAVGHSHHKSHLSDEPILSADADNDKAILEQRYEVRFKGEIPKSIVGFELDNYYGTWIYAKFCLEVYFF